MRASCIIFFINNVKLINNIYTLLIIKSLQVFRRIDGKCFEQEREVGKKCIFAALNPF